MPTDIIQWFPGHMAKTRRLIGENLKKVDLVIELLDARIPKSSRNPEIMRLIEGKPLITLLNKASLADPAETEKWVRYYTGEGHICLPFDCVAKKGVDRLLPAVRELMADKLERYQQKGMSGRKLKAMVVGIPNVGNPRSSTCLAAPKRPKWKIAPALRLRPNG